MELVDKKCRHPDCDHVYHLTATPNGCCLVLRGKCPAGHSYIWVSSDVIANKNHAKTLTDNIHLSSAIVLSGNHYHKIKMLGDFFGLRVPCSSVFHAHQRHYICPAVGNFYLNEHVRKIYHKLKILVAKKIVTSYINKNKTTNCLQLAVLSTSYTNNSYK